MFEGACELVSSVRWSKCSVVKLRWISMLWSTVCWSDTSSCLDSTLTFLTFFFFFLRKVSWLWSFSGVVLLSSRLASKLGCIELSSYNPVVLWLLSITRTPVLLSVELSGWSCSMCCCDTELYIYEFEGWRRSSCGIIYSSGLLSANALTYVLNSIPLSVCREIGLSSSVLIELAGLWLNAPIGRIIALGAYTPGRAAVANGAPLGLTAYPGAAMPLGPPGLTPGPPKLGIPLYGPLEFEALMPGL